MKSKQGALAALFGRSNNEQFAKLLKQLSETVTLCSRHFLDSGGRDLKGIVDFEHKAMRSSTKFTSCWTTRLSCASTSPIR